MVESVTKYQEVIIFKKIEKPVINMGGSASSFTRFVSLPKGMRADTLAPCLKSLAMELEKLAQISIVGLRIDTVDRKLIITFEGEDPAPLPERHYGAKGPKKKVKGR